MRYKQTRATDATFDLNLAPVLDIIVSIVPMLLLSVAFVQVKMIEAPTPQVVQSDKATPDTDRRTTITLEISKKSGFVFHVTDAKGVETKQSVGLNGAELNYEGLLSTAIQLKATYPDVNQLQLTPGQEVSFDEIVRVMDQVRQKPRAQAEKMSITDAAKAKPVENSYLFPEIIFSSVGG